MPGNGKRGRKGAPAAYPETTPGALLRGGPTERYPTE